MNHATIEQAGAVTFRVTGEVSEFLIVRAKKNPQHWIFPKGHIEPGEPSEAAAVRELREEAGALGEVVAPLGETQYRSGTDTVRVEYYLCRFREQVDDGEGRERLWCRAERARALLSFEDLRDFIGKALELIT